MRNFVLACVAMLVAGAGQAQAGVLTFDETTALLVWSGGALADGFSIPGLTLTAGAATNLASIPGNVAFSGANAMYNFNSREGRLIRDSSFDLVGAYFKDEASLQLTTSTFRATGYDASGTLLYSSVHTLGDNWAFIALNMAGISDFRFDPLSPGTQNMLMDDFTYNESSSTVPEPASLAIFGIGALGLVAGGIRRRKKQTA